MRSSSRIHPLHIAHLPTAEPSPLPSPAPFARPDVFDSPHTAEGAPPPVYSSVARAGGYESYLDGWSLNELCVPSAPLLAVLWGQYQGGGAGKAGLLPFVGLSGFARDLTLRVLAYHEGRGGRVGRGEEREAVLPGYEHDSLDESVMCVMKELSKRMGTRIDRRVWDERLGPTIYAVWTRKEREAEHRHKMRVKRGRQKSRDRGDGVDAALAQQRTCAVM